MRVILSSFLVVLVSLGAVAGASDGGKVAGLTPLAKIERKFFGHGFEADPDEVRVSRLENLIFGETETGSIQERIGKVIAFSTKEEAGSPATTTSEPGKPAQDLRLKTPVSKNQKVPVAAEATDSSELSQEESSEQSDYPHIGVLEKAMLGGIYAGQPLPQRLGRLETKAFGKPSNLADLSQRTDALDQYAEKKMHLKLFPTPETGEVSYDAENASDSKAPASSSTQNSSQTQSETETVVTDYPHITALEKAILGQAYPDQAIADRLSRLETTAFGAPSDLPDLSRRTDALESYAQKKLHQKPFQVSRSAEAAAEKSSGSGSGMASGMSKQILAMAANTLLQATGLGGVGGLALAGAGMGIDAVRAQQQRSAPKEQAEAEEVEDPAAFAAVPPPPGAKLLAKVAWCEAQVFGRTFAVLHLKERLRKLSQELKFNTEKTELQLMDDMDALIKTVQLKQEKALPIGSAPQPTVK